MLRELEEWMEKNKFATIEDFVGTLAQENITDPLLYERAQFMKYYSHRNK